jgi:hypothetical protein
MQQGERRACALNGTVWLFCRRRGALRIHKGREIVVEPAPGADERIVRNWVMGQGLGVTMFQRGFLVLHASVVRSGGQGIAFAGPSGAGKSTLAMAFSQSGDAVLADDHAVVTNDDIPMVLPAFPQVKLREDTVRNLEESEGPSGCTPVSEEKVGWNIRSHFVSEAVPLNRIYVLAEGEKFRSTPLSPAAAAAALAEQSFLSTLLVKPEAAADHRERCAKLAERVCVERLERPRFLEDLPGTVRQLREPAVLVATCG